MITAFRNGASRRQLDDETRKMSLSGTRNDSFFTFYHPA
jgi:hypothetical protein